MFEDDWLHPIVDGKNGDAGLIYSTSASTSLLLQEFFLLLYNAI